MDAIPGPEHRWYHPLGYPSQHAIYQEGANFVPVAGSQSSQAYPAETMEHFFHSHSDSDSGSWPRGVSHNPYHSACHQSTQHHLPSSNNLQESSPTSPHSTGCSSRLYLPSSCGRSPHLNLHQMAGCPNGSTSWHSSYSQHLLSQSNSTNSTYNSHGNSVSTSNLNPEKDSKVFAQREAFASAYYNGDDKTQTKMSLQNSNPAMGFPSQIYGANINGSEFAGSGLPYSMLGEMSRMARYRGITYPVADQGFGKFFSL